MNLCKLCCVGFVGIFLSIIGLVIYTGYELGEFYEINPHRMDKCKSIPTPKSHGLTQECEDIQALSDGSMLISCGHLHDIFQTFSPHYIPYYNYQTMSQRISKLPQSKKGGIYRIQRKDQYTKPIAMKLSKYAAPDFNPHGMSIIKHRDTEFLFVINHRRDGEYLSVFKVDTDNNKLIYWTSITSDSFNLINNVAVIPGTNGNFYYTNWMKNDPGSWQGVIELFAKQKTSQVQHCQTPDNFLTRRPSRNVNVKCQVVVDELRDANGITLANNNDRLFFVSGNHLLGYDIDKNDAKKLTLYSEIDTVYACDNVNPSPTDDNELLLGCFPKPLRMLYEIQRYPSSNIAAMVRSVDIDKKESVPVRIDPSGNVISGTTAALQHGPYTVVVSVFDRFRYMVCTELEKGIK